jgi:hypothetical protein
MGDCSVGYHQHTHDGTTMPKKADGIQFQDPHLTVLVKRIMDEFVEDTTIWQNSEHPSQETTIQAIVARLQIAAQWWSNYGTARADNSSYPNASTTSFTRSLAPKVMPGSLHLMNWIFRSLFGKVPTTMK